MTASNDLRSLNSGISSPSAGTAESVALLPPPANLCPQTPASDEHAGVPIVRFDRLLLVGVVALAFLVASTPARNSDVWLHLATGRAIAEGSYRFQSDPFSHNAASPWIAHSWLYDLVSYTLFTYVGGPILVLLKASLVALLAALLIRLGTRDRGLLWPALAATLAVLAMCGRLLLQPALLSALLLAATLSLVERCRRLRAAGKGWLSAYGPIAVLFALWANLDDWFLLGPLTLGLSLLGELLGILAGAGDKKDADLPGLALALGVGLLACLLTPFHIHGFTLPTELGLTATAQALKHDSVLGNLFVSPFEARYFHSGTAWSIPGLAYLVLVVLSAGSFLGSRDAWRSWRLPVWLGLFGLSAWILRAVPFFAVAAGPILALNLQDLATRYRPDWRRHEGGLSVRLGRAAAILGLLALLAAAWPGWLQGAPYERRRWVVLADPSLQQTAEKLAEWRKDRRLTEEDRGLSFSPKAANYLLWFCPREKNVLDGRLNVSATEAEEYVRIRQALLDPNAKEQDWRGYFRAKGINHIILEGEDRERMSRTFPRLISASSEWFLMSVTGHTTIFGWKDPQKRVSSPTALRFTANREAYHPSTDTLPPRHGVQREAKPPKWWNGFVAVRPAGHADRDAAELLLLYFDILHGTRQPKQNRVWEVSRIAALVAEGGPTLLAPCRQALSLNCFTVNHVLTPTQVPRPLNMAEKLAQQLQANYFRSQDDAPSELLFLALRAAWRGTVADSQDAVACSLLGDGYLRLARNTRERAWIESNRLPFLRRLRSVQAASAYHRALRIDPDLFSAHAGLVSLYEQFALIDLALQHLREAVRILQTDHLAMPQGEEPQKRMIAYLQDQVRSLTARQQQALDSYELATAKTKNIVERAGIALDRGLAETALDLLLSSDVAAFGAQGVEMELGLLLIAGRVDQAREWLLPEHEQLLGAETYRLYRLQLAAAHGDYEQADAELAAMLDAAERPVKYYTVPATIPQAIALALAQMLLDARTEKDSLPQRGSVIYHRQQLFQLMVRLTDNRAKTADIRTMRGLLDLESGNVQQAAVQFRDALRLYSPEPFHPSGFGIDFSSRGLAECFLSRLEQAR